MAKYWVGGTGNTNDPTNHWATTDGGAPGAGNAPTAADDVFFTASSGAGTCTVNAALACRSIQSTGSSVATLVHNAAIDITIGDATAGAGNIALDLSGFTTYTLGDALTSRLIFASSNSAVTQTINPKGFATGDWGMSVTGGKYQLTAGFTQSATSRVTWANPSLDFNGQTCTIGLFIASATTVRTLTLGAAVITVIGTGGSAWNIANSANITVSSGTSSITFSGASPTFTGGAKTWYDVSFTGSTATTLVTSCTFHNLSRIGTAATTNSLTLTFGTTQTVTNLLTITGNSIPNHVIVNSSFVTVASTLNAASVSLTNAYFTDITGAGAASPFTGTSVGDCMGNSGITFDTPKNRYRVAGSAFNTTATWATTSGGAPGASIPLPQDTAVFDANSGTGTTSQNMTRIPGIDASTSSACTFTFNTACSCFGSVNWGGSLTLSGTASFSLTSRNSPTLTTNTKTVTAPLAFTTYGTTATILDDLTTTNTLNHSGGTLDLNSKAITCTTYTSNNVVNLTRVLKFGTSTMSLSSTASGAIWLISSPTGYSVTKDSGTIAITAASANARIFTGGSVTYPTLTYTVAGSTGSLTISDTGNSFDVINFSDITNARTLTFTSGTTVTINTGVGFNVDGTSGKLMTLNASTPSSQATLAITSGTVNCDYLAVVDNAASGSVPAYAGPNGSISNTTNWVASAPPSGSPNLMMMGVG